MIIKKIISVLFLMSFIFSVVTLYPGERKVVRTMKELTNPNSPSYVPVPYPQTRDEILTDLKFGLQKLYTSNQSEQLIYKKESKGAFIDLLRDNPGIIIKEIIKVKNRISTLSDDYTFLINLVNEKGDSIGRIAMEACGLILSTAKPENSSRTFKSLKNKEQIVNNILVVTGHLLNKDDVKHTDRIAFISSIGDVLFPAWEIVLKDGSIFYSDYFENVYRLKKQEDLYDKKVNISALRKYNIETNIKIIIDSINEKVLYIEKINK